jgi:hypothetical protein
VSDEDRSAVAQLGGDAMRAVGAAGGLVDVGDLTGQPIRRSVRGGSGRPFQA